ncbi:MAG: molybdopterin synthase sulfur carrier subunit, partial [Blastocatellia bacterium]|nr:molybdopterin synthase sulfur carrier subunit [Blastocatellia bacterium]
MTRIEIKILLFGACKDAVGRQEISLELDEGSSVATAFELLKAEFPELTKF